jgi:hypothetical protein
MWIENHKHSFDGSEIKGLKIELITPEGSEKKREK